MNDDFIFEVGNPTHTVELARLIEEIIRHARNAATPRVRFALLLWDDGHDEMQAIVSNDPEVERVADMLDDAKERISTPDATLYESGHA